MASRGLVFNNSVGSVNLFPWVHHETIQRGQLSRSPLGRRPRGIMASIETSIDLTRQLTIHIVTGEITFVEIVEAVAKYYQGTITQLLLWDFTHASMTQTTSEQIRQLVDLSRPFTSRRKGGKTALLFATDVDFGIGRMYEIQVSGLDESVSHRAFRDKDSALKWLLS